MAELGRNGSLERDVEQAITALKKGAHLLKYRRKGKPRFCPFRLSNDEKTLIWFYGKEEMHLNLNLVSRIVPGQRTAKFQRNPCPEKECQSFSLIYGQDDQSLDVICKDKDQAELWFVGLKALINGSQLTKSRVDMKGNDVGLLSDGSSPLGHMRRNFNECLVDTYRMQNAYGSPPPQALTKAFSSAALYSVDSRKGYPDNTSLGDSFPPLDYDVGSDVFKMQAKDTNLEGFRVSLSSVMSYSSQGSGHDDCDAMGDVYMWGEGIGDGLLGGGSYRLNGVKAAVDSLLPKQLESAIVLDAHNIACGSRHSALVNRQGEVFCWGEESGGRLGHGVDVHISHPQLVEALANTHTEFVACGEYHTCAVTLTGELYTWGDGTKSIGLLGQGGGEVSHWIPKRVPLSEGLRIASVACGPWHTALVSSAGHLLTFGNGTFGALGHGDNKCSLIPREVESLKGLKTIRAACGTWHTAAVVEIFLGCSSGKLFTWGDGDKGQLGHGVKGQRLLPTCVAALVEQDFHQVACGQSLTVALTTTGQVYTMGSTVFGQLGNPQASGLIPGLVEGNLKDVFVEEISCGAYHVAALTSKTEVYTWGKGANGRLGHGDVLDRNTPILVEALKDKQVKTIACGSSFTAAICLHKWFSGADHSVCSGCRMSFGFTRKRHNCYNCGQLFCHACSSKKAAKATLAPSPKKPYRVCDPCFVKLKTVMDVGAASQRGIVRKSGMTRQSSEGKVRVEKSDSKVLKTLSLPPFDQNRCIDQSKQQPRKRESLRRVSPAPSETGSRGSAKLSPFFDSSFSILKIPQSPISVSTARSASAVVSPLSRRPTPPRSITPPPLSGSMSSYDIGFFEELKKRNQNLTQEVLKLQSQVDALNRKCHLQDTQLQHAAKEIEKSKAIAAEERGKCKAAKEVIKSLTVQMKDMADRMPSRMQSFSRVEGAFTPRFHATNGGHTLISEGLGSELEDNIRFNEQKCAASPTQITQDADMDLRNPYVSTSYGSHMADRFVQAELVNSRSQQDSDSAMGDTAKPGVTFSLEQAHHLETIMDKEWVEQDDPGVYITFVALTGGVRDLKRVRFSRKKFSEKQAEQWWADNRARVYEKYNIRGLNGAVSGVRPCTTRAP